MLRKLPIPSTSVMPQRDDLVVSQAQGFPFQLPCGLRRAGTPLDLQLNWRRVLNSFYYFVKPMVPKPFQLYLRRKSVAYQRRIHSDTWPIDQRANRPPEEWRGWPEGRQFCLVLTHDVDQARGVERSYALALLEKERDFRSSFNFVAEGYAQDSVLHQYLSELGFEIGVHGLVHTGNLFRSSSFFWTQLPKINSYIRDWQAVGFRAPSMYHDLELIQHMEIEYDASTFDTDPFEPQPDGMGTIYPVWIQANSSPRGFVELPYTLPQDFTLFVLMGQKEIDIWRRKLDWIAECGGMALVNTHPDYMSFDGQRPSLGEYPAEYYQRFLEYVKSQYGGCYWHVLPKELAEFWRQTYGHGRQ
jgi:hypothetical protein